MSHQVLQTHNRTSGFTIVELLIVIVVIAILAAITIVTYGNVAGQAREASLKSDLQNGVSQLEISKIQDGSYPADSTSLKKSGGTVFTYASNNSMGIYCLGAMNPQIQDKKFYVTESGSIQSGECPELPKYMQTLTGSTCPTTRTVAVDARDKHSYWIQKLADGKCWMLTNLAYGGGGINTNYDVKTLIEGTNDTASTFTSPKFYIPPNANPTTVPATPSASTDGGATKPQYGYFYNWCAAMGAQNGTNGQPISAACQNATSPSVDSTISICPAGWYLPAASDFTALNNTTNGGSTTSDAGLRSLWLAQWGGSWDSAFGGSQVFGVAWSSTQASATDAYRITFYSTGVSPTLSAGKYGGFPVRCIAANNFAV